MEIQLGRHVISSDGQQLGKVDRLVLDTDRRDLVEIIVHKGILLTDDRMIERGFIDVVDDDGTVRLNVTADEVDDLPLFVREEYLTPNLAEPGMDPSLPDSFDFWRVSGPVASSRHLRLGHLGSVELCTNTRPASDRSPECPQFMSQTRVFSKLSGREGMDPYLIAAGSEGVLWSTPTRLAHYGWYGQERSIFEPSSFTSAEVELRSNLPPGTIAVDGGAEVVAADGKEIGHVTEVTVDEEGDLQSLRVRMGHLGRHHEADIPSAMIESITHRRVSLIVPAVEIEHRAVPAGPGGELVVDIERRVVSREGQTVGEIDRLIVNPKTMKILTFVIREGFIFRDEKLLDPAMIQQTFDDGTVELAISTDEAHALPPFVREQYYVPSPERFHSFSSEGWAGSTIVDPEVLGPTHTGDQPRVIQAGNVPPDGVILTEDTAVYGDRGDKIGMIDQVAYTPDHVLTALILCAGKIFHHDIRIPAEWIGSMRHDRIALQVSREECERRLRQDQAGFNDVAGHAIDRRTWEPNSR